LLLKAVQSIPEGNAELTAAAEALIAARSSLISAAQRLANAAEQLKQPKNKLIPPIAQRLKALKYTLN